MEQKEFMNVVNAQDDVQVLKNVIQILLEEGLEYSTNKACTFETLKQAYSEMVGNHFFEELADFYIEAKGLPLEDTKAMAQEAYEKEIKGKYEGVNLWDFTILFARMSINKNRNTVNSDYRNTVVADCKVFLDNDFWIYSIEL